MKLVALDMYENSGSSAKAMSARSLSLVAGSLESIASSLPSVATTRRLRQRPKKKKPQKAKDYLHYCKFYE